MSDVDKKKHVCKICGTEYDSADDAMKCIEKCKEKRDMDMLPALIENMDWATSQIEVMWKTVAVGTTPEEFAYFLNVADAAGLNPFLREIYCWKSNSGKLTIMTGRDGYLKTAKNDPTFQGMHSMEVCEKDVFEMEYKSGAMKVSKHEIRDFVDRGKIIGAWAQANFKGQSPIVVYASAAEYKQGNKDVWKKNESAMMRKVPESMALKRGAGISGLVTHEEMDVPRYVSAALESGEFVDVEYNVVDDDRERIVPEHTALPGSVGTDGLGKIKLPGILNKEKTRLKVGKYIVETNGDGTQIWSDIPKFGSAGFQTDACVPCLVAGLVGLHGIPFVSGKFDLKFVSEEDDK